MNAFEDLAVVVVGERGLAVEEQADAEVGDLRLRSGYFSWTNVPRPCARCKDAGGHEFLEGAVGGDEGDGELLAEVFGAGHLLPGDEDAAVDRVAQDIPDGRIQRPTRLRFDGLQYFWSGH